MMRLGSSAPLGLTGTSAGTANGPPRTRLLTGRPLTGSSNQVRLRRALQSFNLNRLKLAIFPRGEIEHEWTVANAPDFLHRKADLLKHLS